MLAWVYQAASACRQLDQVLIATDSDEVQAYAADQGWACVMTSPDLASGTDRVHAVSSSVEADIYVNIQGDEPLLRPEHIDSLLLPFARNGAEMTTLSTPCPTREIDNPNAVKVVVAKDGRALYFSRATIPHNRGVAVAPQKHLGLYAYRKAALRRFAGLPPGRLEMAERLEQLRALENGMDIYVESTEFDTIGVDTEEDRLRAEKMLMIRFTV
jgi:3-deoxy-manno-octulosonate cytidylyltransferase (CMP-KDO synthetase)